MPSPPPDADTLTFRAMAKAYEDWVCDRSQANADRYWATCVARRVLGIYDSQAMQLIQALLEKRTRKD